MKRSLIYATGEIVLAESKHSPWGYFGTVAVGVLLCVMGGILRFSMRSSPLAAVGMLAAVLCVIGGIFVSLMLSLSLHSEKMIITDRRIFFTKGFLAVRSVSILLWQADTLRLSRSVMGQVFRYSTIEIVAAGTAVLSSGNTVPEKFSFLSNAEELNSVFLQAASLVRN